MAAALNVISSPNATISHAERRQLSVMFCDLVGSTALSTKLDPEDMREVLRAYQNAVVESIACLDGHVAKFLGDGVLAYFGWPTAHEDEAGRAVRSALAAIRAVANLRAPDGDALAARIGIATGLVVVGDLLGEGSAREEAIVGETPNLAARLQAIAGSGEIVIAESTRRLVGNAFILGQLGPQELKGFAGPVTAYAVRAETSAERRFEAFEGATRLIGREHEFNLLLEAWESARAGHGRTLLVRGEPGIGKSHIAHALIDRAITDRAAVLRYFCSPYHTSTALFPIIEQLKFAAGLDAESKSRLQLAKLEALLGRAVKMPQRVLPLLATLCGIAEEGPSSASTLTPGALKSRTFDALINQITGLAHQSPVMMLFEDLHWLDPTTAEFLTMVISTVPRLPLLMLGTARPEFQPTWPVNVVELSRLDRRQSVALIERVIESKFLPEALEAEILVKTEGIPLFIEELTKTVVETVGLTEVGQRYELTKPLSAFAVPATLYDSLMARLDRLGSPKAVAQIAAVIGREFPL